MIYGVTKKSMTEWQDYFSVDIVYPQAWIDAGIPGDKLLTEAEFIKLALGSFIQPHDMSFFEHARKLEENGGLFVP